MTNEQEQKLKGMAAEQWQAQSCCGTDGTVGTGQCGSLAQPTLRERIHSQRYRAQVEAQHAEKLMELECLLDKHPEVSRILELLDMVKL